MSPSDTRAGFRLTGWHVLGAFVLFFGVTAAVDAVMVTDAYRSFPGQVTSSPYEEGLRFDAALHQQQAQAALGWRMTAGFARPGLVELTVQDRTGAPVSLARLEARLERPATEVGRIPLRFTPASRGVYRAEARAAAGAWDLRLSAYDHQGRRFDAERRLMTP